MKEFDFIKSLKNNIKSGRAEIGIGDDSALAGNFFIAKDIAVENTHFTKNAPIKDILFRVFTANVSDINAMGARAEYVLLGIGLPKNRYSSEELNEALKFCTAFYDVELIGGDTVSSKDILFISVTVLGQKEHPPLLRSGAKAGDAVYISRPTGLCRYYLEQELDGLAVFDHYRVNAETKLGKILSSSGLVNSCIDVSDGISSDIRHIAEASGVKIIIEEKALPMEKLKSKVKNTADYFLNSGEEFALLFTLPDEKSERLEKIISEKLNRNIYKIGRVENGSGVFIETNNETKPLSPSGFEHSV